MLGTQELDSKDRILNKKLDIIGQCTWFSSLWNKTDHRSEWIL
jgi:hypothetical protein